MTVAKLQPQTGDLLFLADIQVDFLPGGALGVPAGDQVVAPLQKAMALFTSKGLPVFAGRDWHPREHCSFQSQGGPWPPHCVRDTPGARFAPQLTLPAGAKIISKATERDKEAYSAFEGTSLAAELRAAGVTRIFIGGLATEYCVLNTVLDAVRQGFAAIVLEDAVRAIDLQPGDGENALRRMQDAGAVLARTAQLESR